MTRRGFTLAETMVAVAVFGLVSLVIFQFTRWMNNAQSMTGWKQSALDAIRLNEVFWQKYFSAATGKIKSLVVDGKGVILAPPEIATEAVKIRSSGNGDLMAGFTDGASEWPVWRFNAVQKKDDGGTGFQDQIVTAFLSGKRPHVRLSARVEVDGKTILKQELLSNLAGLQSEIRSYDEENAKILTIEFLLQHPTRREMTMREKSRFRISTVVEPL